MVTVDAVPPQPGGAALALTVQAGQLAQDELDARKHQGPARWRGAERKG